LALRENAELKSVGIVSLDLVKETEKLLARFPNARVMPTNSVSSGRVSIALLTIGRQRDPVAAVFLRLVSGAGDSNHARVVRFGIRSKLNCRQSENHDPEYVKNDFYLAWNATV
jgi:hypothetical protein